MMDQTNGNFQYYNNGIQPQIFPTNTQNVNYNTVSYDSNYDIQQRNIDYTQMPNGLVNNVLPPNCSQMYSYNQNPYTGQITDHNTRGSDNLNYQSQMLSSHPNVPNNFYPKVSPTSPPPINNPPYLSQMSPQISQNKQNLSAQPSSIMTEQMKNMKINKSQMDYTIDLMQTRNLFDDDNNSSNVPKTCFPTNCDANIMQCTLNTLPIESSMLSKCRLPLGVHIQPFRDTDITLVQTNTIVRCRSCRTYINPFVTLTDHQRRWHCNVCGRVNDIPDEFMHDPVTKTYGSPMKRPELIHSNIEYTANPDYTVRPPMATIYVFCLDVSQAAIASGYLRHTCDLLIENLNKMPGDGRKQIAFLTYNSCLHFYQIHENSFKTITWSDISEVDIPVSEDLLVNIDDRKEIIVEFLHNLPSMFPSPVDCNNCLGYALQVAMKLITHNGGRVTVVNGSLPNVGLGTLTAREGKESESKIIQPATDFYKTLALQCANDQISVDLFCINRQYSDIASFSAISRHSSGGFYYYGNFRALVNEDQRLGSLEQLDFDRFTKDFRRYLTRKIGLEAVMRTRCSRGVDLTAFHGNLFMRSTNVIALPVVNPDASYAIQFKINGSLSEWSYVIIQAALLYTTSNSDRRIRVHTICLPLTDKIEQVFLQANSGAIAGFIAKIALDKCLTDGLKNVREAFVNSLVDPLKAYEGVVGQGRGSKSLLCPHSLRQLAPYVAGLLRNEGFRDRGTGSVDERVAMLECVRWLPLADVLRVVYPCLVSLVPWAGEPRRLALSSANLAKDGVYVMDCGTCLYLILGSDTPAETVQALLGYASVRHIPGSRVVCGDGDRDTEEARHLGHVRAVLATRCLGTSLVVASSQDPSVWPRLMGLLVDDRTDHGSMSYYDFLKSVQVSVTGV